jgi:transmembrane sensor
MDPGRKVRSAENQPSASVVQKAAEWLAHLESGDASDQDRSDFETWRLADPRHALALDRLSGVRERLADGAGVEREALRRLLLRPRRSGAPFVIVLALLGAGWAGSRLPAVQLMLADQTTPAGEARALDLADGSRLTLSTDSAVNIDVDRRTVTLLKGEVLANVAKRSGTNFTVRTRDGTATALGTTFTVRKEATSTLVAVAESQVRVCPEDGDAGICMTLSPGQGARLTTHGVERFSGIPVADIGAWADGWLSAEDRPLVEVLDELNRWRTTPIAFDRRALADLRVSGIFPLRDPDKATANLTALLPLVLDNSNPTAPVVRRR